MRPEDKRMLRTPLLDPKTTGESASTSSSTSTASSAGTATQSQPPLQVTVHQEPQSPAANVTLQTDGTQPMQVRLVQANVLFI